MTESVTKETLIPLKYIIQFAKALLLTVKKGEISNKISLILSIAKVLEAKIQVVIDQNLISKGSFETCEKLKGLNSFVNKIIKSLQE
jgi:hypothetical protein